MTFKDQPAYQRAMREIERRSVAMAHPGTEHGVPEGWGVASPEVAERRPPEGDEHGR